jgi:dTDP-4-amino-4,6-dideoxygalactose transaminase
LTGFVEFQKNEDFTTHSNWMFGVKFNKDVDKISLELYKQGVETRPMFPVMSEHNHLKFFSNPDSELNSKLLSKNCLILPSHPNLLKGDINYICNLIKKNIKNE